MPLPKPPLLLLSALALLTTHFAAQASPPRGAMMRSQAQMISKTIGSQARKALRPRFLILSRYAEAMTAVSFSADGTLLATAGANHRAQLWSLESGQLLHTLKGHQGPILALAQAAGEPLLATADGSGVIRLWNRGDGNATGELSGHRGKVLGLALSGDGKLLASGGEDHTLRLWQLPAGRERQALKHPEAVTALVLGGDGKRLASACRDGKVRLWDPVAGRLLQTLDAPGGATLALALSPDSKSLAAAGEGGRIALWNAADGHPLGNWEAHPGAVSALAFSPDGRTLASAAERTIRIWPTGGGEPLHELNGHEERVNGLAFSRDGRFLASAAADRTTRLWDAADGKERLRLVAMLDGWAAVTPEGQFDGTLDGREEDRLEAIKWAVGDKQFSLDGFLERYYQPGLLGRLAAKREVVVVAPETPPPPPVSEGFELPPEVEFEKPSVEAAERRRQAEVTVVAADAGGGIDEVRLYHNEKVVDDSYALRAVFHRDDREGETKTYRVPLMTGENRFRAVGFSRDRIEGLPVELDVKLERAATEVRERKGVLHLVVVGINAYRNPDLTLNFGVPDARGVLDEVKKGSQGLFDRVEVHPLLDERATHAGIEQTLDGLRDSAPEDVVMIFFAGHGDSIGDDWYFVPQELMHPEEGAQLMRGGFSSTTLRDKIARMGARRVFLLIDACRSGTVADAFERFDDYRPTALLARSTGIHVGTASTKEQYAAEIGSLGHGLFTYTLMEAFSGEADLLPADGAVTVEETLEFVRNSMPGLIRQYRLPRQDPVLNSRGMDFRLVKYRKR